MSGPGGDVHRRVQSKAGKSGWTERGRQARNKSRQTTQETRAKRKNDDSSRDQEKRAARGGGVERMCQGKGPALRAEKGFLKRELRQKRKKLRTRKKKNLQLL